MFLLCCCYDTIATFEEGWDEPHDNGTASRFARFAIKVPEERQGILRG